MEGDNNRNRLSKSRSKDFRIGIVQGGCGQSFGEEEIITAGRRLYSVQCESTENVVLVLSKESFNAVNSTPAQIKWLKQENKLKLEGKSELYNKIVDTKKNYKKYAKLIDEKNQLAKTEELRESISKIKEPPIN